MAEHREPGEVAAVPAREVVEGGELFADAASADQGAGRAWLVRLHVLLGVQSLLLVLALVNRLWSATDVYVLPHEALRLVDLLNLLVFPPASVLASYLLLEHLLPGAPECSNALATISQTPSATAATTRPLSLSAPSNNPRAAGQRTSRCGANQRHSSEN